MVCHCGGHGGCGVGPLCWDGGVSFCLWIIMMLLLVLGGHGCVGGDVGSGVSSWWPWWWFGGGSLCWDGCGSFCLWTMVMLLLVYGGGNVDDICW